jgi:IMP dehydrogenase
LRNYPNAAKDNVGRLIVGAALGITQDLMDRAAALQFVGVDVVTLDSAHGHSKGVIQALKALRKNFKHLQIIAGNVGTAAGAKALAEAGADCVKVGIGPGSICTTRIVAGAGVPQLTAIMEASNALKGKNIPGDRRWRDPLYRRYGKSTRCRRQCCDDGKCICRC